MKQLFAQIRISLIATFALAVLLCGIYPLLVWALAQGLFSAKANGSLVQWKGAVAGSTLIGQNFADPKYFHPRPSAAGFGYDALSSGGSNLGPISRKLVDTVSQRVMDYRKENHLEPSIPIPPDAVTASGSGLDPHISLENAQLQAARVARARGISMERVQKTIRDHTERRDLGLFGEPKVNVLLLNIALEAGQ